MSGKAGEEDDIQPPPSKKQRTEAVEREGGEGIGVKVQESSSSPVQESDVGITEFVSQHEGFFAILKRRLVCCLNTTIRRGLCLVQYIRILLSQQFRLDVVPAGT